MTHQTSLLTLLTVFFMHWTVSPHTSFGQIIVAPREPYTAPFYDHFPHVVSQGPGGRTSHTGLLEYDIDFAQRRTDGVVPVLASAGGTVGVHYDPNSFGTYVTIDHGPDIFTPGSHLFSVYGHLAAPLVTEGQMILAGDILGLEGESGIATGPHVHFGVYSGDPNKNPFQEPESWEKRGLDPDPYLGGVMELALADGGDPGFYSTPDFPSLVGDLVYSTIQVPETSRWESLLALGQTEYRNFYVASTSELQFSLQWPGSELAVTIIDPDGNQYLHQAGTNGAINGAIDNARSGVWSFGITGLDVSPNGEQYEFSISSQAVPAPSSFCLATLGAIVLWIMFRGSFRFRA